MNPDFRDLLRALSDAGARFLVVGAYAVSFHAEPRATGDLDIWIDPSLENAGRVYRALVAFGAPLTQLTERDLAAAVDHRGSRDRVSVAGARRLTISLAQLPAIRNAAVNRCAARISETYTRCRSEERRVGKECRL